MVNPQESHCRPWEDGYRRPSLITLPSIDVDCDMFEPTTSPDSNYIYPAFNIQLPPLLFVEDMAATLPPDLHCPDPEEEAAGSDSTIKPKKKNVSVACLECRKKRRKCVNEGIAPCVACRRSNGECIIDESLDRRRREAIADRMAQIKLERQFLSRIVATFCSDDEDQIRALIWTIKTAPSFDDLLRLSAMEEMKEMRDKDPRFSG